VIWLGFQAVLIVLPILQGSHFSAGVLSTTVVSTFFKRKTSPLSVFLAPMHPLAAYIGITEFKSYTLAIYATLLLLEGFVIFNEYRKIQSICAELCESCADCLVERGQP
jgi:hypothetical protein